SLKASGKTIFLSSHLLAEVEQICDQIVIVSRGHVVRTGTMQQLLTTGDQVEILANGVNQEIQLLLQERGAIIEALPSGVRVLASGSHKREIVERLWAAGFDVLSLRPVKGSLEELYMTLVGGNAA